MKNYYDILGVTPDASLETIKFTYKALAKIYHPDTYKGDKKYAESKMKEINQAYVCLSNKTLRKKYDDGFFKNKDDFNETSGTSQHEDLLNDDWDYAVEYHPELVTHYNVLKKLNKNLAFQFKINIVQNKKYGNALQITEDYIIKYLKRYYGRNTHLHNIVFYTLMKDRKDIAREINVSIKKLGDSSHKAIIEQIKLRFYPFFSFFIDKKFSYESYTILNSVSNSMENVISSSHKVLSKSIIPNLYNIGKKILISILYLVIIGLIISLMNVIINL